MHRHRLAALAGIPLLSLLPTLAHATNGYFTAGVGAQSQSQAGVGVSSADSVDAAALNPALGLKAGNSVGGGIGLFSPSRDDTNSGGNAPGYDLGNGKHTSGEDLFEVPYLGANFQLDDKTAASILLYANGGMNTHYASNPFSGLLGVHGSTPAGVDLDQLFLQPNVARALGGGFSVGAGPVLAIQRFAARGLQGFDNPFVSSAPGSVTNRGYDYSYGGGFKLGATYDPIRWLTLGAVYQSRIWSTDFSKYKGLFANQGNFDIPASTTEGLTIRPIPTVALSLEYQRIFYGDVASIANQGSAPGLLGASGGKGFGWKDMNIFRLGLQWKPTDQLALRTGFSHATDFTNSDNVTFNILAPATIKDHASIGAGYDITPNWTIDVAYTHAFSQSLTGTNQFDPAQTVKLRMDQDEGTLGVTYRW
jgi:long-chain fatty acid transport protein